MGQKLRDDKIGVLSHNAGVITMAASPSFPVWLTIGGQQYRVTAALNRTIATDITMVANTLYMVYAVLSAGSVVLRISSNVNSVGPVGFTSWKLVGAFYANSDSSPIFGAFCTIDGVPTTGWITSTTVTLVGFGTPTNIVHKTKRDGPNQRLDCRFNSGVSTATEARIPLGQTSDSTISTLEICGQMGVGTSASGTSFVSATLIEPSVTYVTFGQQTSSTAILVKRNGNALTANTEAVSVTADVQINGWSNVSLKDL